MIAHSGAGEQVATETDGLPILGITDGERARLYRWIVACRDEFSPADTLVRPLFVSPVYGGYDGEPIGVALTLRGTPIPFKAILEFNGTRESKLAYSTGRKWRSLSSWSASHRSIDDFLCGLFRAVRTPCTVEAPAV